MSERKTRGRQRIPIKLIENKDDLLVSFSKRRVGVYKKASELSTLCGVDVGAIIFSPSGIPHSFFTPDFESVVYGRRNPGEHRDCYGMLVDESSRMKIRELNKRLDQVVEQQEREEKREKQLDGVVKATQQGWWEVPVDRLSVEEVKEQIEWFQALKAQIKNRAQEVKRGGSSSAAEAASLPQDGETSGVAAECFFAPPSLEGFDGGCGTRHVGEQFLFPPPPPPAYYDVGGGSSVNADQYLYPPPPQHHFDSSVGVGSDLFPLPQSLNLFGGGGIGHVEQYFQPSSSAVRGGMGHCLGGGYGNVSAAAQGSGEAAPTTSNHNL